MLLCPESEQFTPGKVFMILFGNKKITEFLRHRTADLRLPHILFIDNDFQQSYTENRCCAIAVIKYFSVHTLNPLFWDRHGVRFSRDGNFSVSTAKIVSVAHIAATG